MREIVKKLSLSAGIVALIALMLPALASATELQLESEPGVSLQVGREVVAESTDMEIANTPIWGDIECSAAEWQAEIRANGGNVALSGTHGSASGCFNVSQYVTIYNFTLSKLLIDEHGVGLIAVDFTASAGGIECSFEGEGAFSYEAGTDAIELKNLPLETYGICGSEAQLNGDFTLSDAWTGEPVLIVDPEWTLQSSAGSVGGGLTDVSCVSDAECVAVGHDYPNATAERWNGSEWIAMTVPGPGLGDVSCSSSTLCVAIPFQGGLGAVRWDGSEWSSITAVTPAGGKNAKLSRVSCGSSTSCIAVGSYVDSSGQTRALAESYDGEEWAVMTAPSEGAGYLASVSCTSSISCTAIGSSGFKPLALRWNGSGWSALGTPKYLGGPSDISCASASSCMAVSLFGGAERWNGSEWVSTPTSEPEDGSGFQELLGVSCPAAGECIAVGTYERSTGYYGPLAERWNGSKWLVQEALVPGGEEEAELRGVSCSSPDRCTAVGWSYTTPLIERYQ